MVCSLVSGGGAVAAWIGSPFKQATSDSLKLEGRFDHACIARLRELGHEVEVLADFSVGSPFKQAIGMADNGPGVAHRLAEIGQHFHLVPQAGGAAAGEHLPATLAAGPHLGPVLGFTEAGGTLPLGWRTMAPAWPIASLKSASTSTSCPSSRRRAMQAGGTL
jgi:hypothetical protein